MPTSSVEEKSSNYESTDTDDAAQSRTLRSEAGSLAVLGLLTRMGQGGSVLLSAVVLQPSLYGQLGVILGAQALVTMLAGQWLEPAVIRTGSTIDNRNGRLPLSLSRRVGRFQATGTLIGGLVTPLAAAIVGASFGIPALWLLAALLAAVVRSFALFLPTSLLRSVGDVRSVQLLMGTCWGGALFLRIGGALVFPNALVGFVVGDLVAALVFAAVCAFRIRHLPRTERKNAGNLSVGFRDLALVPHLTAVWALGYLDRFVLVGSIEDTLLGRYEISYQLALVIGMVANEIARAAMAQYALSATDAASHLRMTLRKAEHGFIVVIFGLATLGSGLAALLWSSIPFLAAYGPYDGTLGIVAAAQLPLAGYVLASIRIANITGQTQRLWLASVGGAFVGLATLILVLPTIDLRLVALASVVGYSATMCIAWALDSSEHRTRKLKFLSFTLAVSCTSALASATLFAHTGAMVLMTTIGVAAIVGGSRVLWIQSSPRLTV